VGEREKLIRRKNGSLKNIRKKEKIGMLSNIKQIVQLKCA
jgi:hypothetical protein